MSVKTATLTSSLSVTEAVSANAPFADVNSRTVLENGVNEVFTLSPATVPAGTLCAAFQQAMTGGVATIDLSNLVGLNGIAVVGTGLKVRGIKFRNPLTNSNDITVGEGATNGYGLLGSGWSLTLSPTQSALFWLNDSAPVVDGTHKTIAISGTGVQALDVILILG